MLAVQMIDRVQFMHEKGILHRDIKPDNFVMGRGIVQNRLYIIDFGLTKKYFDDEQNVHIPLRQYHHITGTPRYASANALMGYELGRRDDMISLGYVLIYFLRGGLPWQGITGTRRQRSEILTEKKLSITPEELCKGYPHEFAAYLLHCQVTVFEKPPNYLHLRRSFCDLFSRLKYIHDDVYDWQLLIDLRKAHDKEDKDKETNKTASSK
ncbi:GH10574 [Drosophila grimshawi]|uniref:non-specific serine/threonine protein kinase n=2 Tax=Drosophila grimshawi TaxID=7222 RepID=B4JDC2_DROGR|nr:GH10574 [Drosophila grimshawi]